MAFALSVSTLALPAASAVADDRSIILATTTSTENSGLLAHILPACEKASGIKVRVVAVGTGQALRMGRDGDADVLLVHDHRAEEAFVADGFGSERRDVMYNDFVIVGPEADPVGLGGGNDAVTALAAIAAQQALFISRGDDSGTHKAERRLWQAGTNARPWETASGTWYREAGAGMGQTLNIAVGTGGYALTDRGTWLAFGNRGGHIVLVEGDPRLFNPYGVVLVSPARHPHVRAQAARAFAVWLTGAAAQALIGGFLIDGERLFVPNAASGG